MKVKKLYTRYKRILFKNGRIIYDLKTNSIAYNAVGLRDDIEKNNELMLNSVFIKKNVICDDSYRGFINYN